MPTLHRVLGWWVGYAAVSFLITLLWGVPPRLAGGYGLLEAIGSTTASAAAMLGLTMIPAMLVFVVWAHLVERRPRLEDGDVSLVASSALLALVIAAGIGLLGVNPAFAWRTGSYAGDAAQATAALFAQAWLAVLCARVAFRARGPARRMA